MSIDPKTSPANTTVAPSRRDILRGGAAAAGLAAFPMIGRTQGNTLRIGVVSPRSGPLALFGEGDGWVLDQVRKQVAGGIEVGGKRWNLEFIAKDTTSNPVRAAAVARELINADKVDFVLSTSTPETVNPVADACEAAGVPSLSTTSPWEAFYFGRGAKPGEPSPFKWTYTSASARATSSSSTPTSGARWPPTRRWACCCRPMPTAMPSAGH